MCRYGYGRWVGRYRESRHPGCVSLVVLTVSLPVALVVPVRVCLLLAQEDRHVHVVEAEV